MSNIKTPEELRIIVESRFIHPIFGGKLETTTKEFKMEEGNAAEIYYNKEKALAYGNAQFMDVTISIVNKRI